MREGFKKMFLGVFCMVCFSLCIPRSVSAKVMKYTVEPLAEGEKITGEDIQRYLNKALEDPKQTYYITVPKGTYQLKYGLHIYSNTTLNLGKAVIKHHGAIGAMIQVGYPRKEEGKSQAAGGGYTLGGYKRGQNIKIIGGTFDANGYSTDIVSSLCTFSHVKNLTLDGVTFTYQPKEFENAHFIEFGGAKNIMIKNCKFIGNENVDEAIQIESTIKGVAHSDLMGKHDATRTKDVTIRNCLFDTFSYGIGTNHGCAKDIYRGMKIMNNEFRNIKKYILCTYNYENVTLKGNTIKGTNRSLESFLLDIPGSTKTSYIVSKNKVIKK